MQMRLFPLLAMCVLRNCVIRMMTLKYTLQAMESVEQVQ